MSSDVQLIIDNVRLRESRRKLIIAIVVLSSAMIATAGLAYHHSRQAQGLKAEIEHYNSVIQAHVKRVDELLIEAKTSINKTLAVTDESQEKIEENMSLRPARYDKKDFVTDWPDGLVESRDRLDGILSKDLPWENTPD